MITYKRHRNSEQIMRKYIIYIEFCNFSMIGHAFFNLKLLKIQKFIMVIVAILRVEEAVQITLQFRIVSSNLISSIHVIQCIHEPSRQVCEWAIVRVLRCYTFSRNM